MVRDGQSYELEVDAATGKITGSEVETDDDRDGDKED